MAAPALAADLPVKAPPPPVIPMYNWTGFYIGGNGGWAGDDACWDIILVAGVLSEGCGHEKSGGVIGGQIGYRSQQPGSHFVWGLEAQGDWANINRSHISVLDPAFTLNSKLDGIGLFTSQFGFAWDTWLWYFKSGFAVTGNRFDITSTVGGLDLVTSSTTRWGGSVGTGIEYGFGAWSIALEYDHLFMGSSNLAFVTPAVTTATLVVPPTFVLNRVSQDVDMVTLRFNYRFNWGGPVVARY
jgi:outer membrane immunogenic protein